MKNEFKQIETEEALRVHRWGEEFNKRQKIKHKPSAETLIKELEDEEHFVERLVEEIKNG